MILETFAKYLQTADPATPAAAILGRWLWERLTMPPEALTDRVLRSEVEVQRRKRKDRGDEQPGVALVYMGDYVFSGRSESGRRLLRSLYEYASSYEQQKWSRWVHRVKATDFNKLYNSD